MRVCALADMQVGGATTALLEGGLLGVLQGVLQMAAQVTIG